MVPSAGGAVLTACDGVILNSLADPTRVEPRCRDDTAHVHAAPTGDALDAASGCGWLPVCGVVTVGAPPHHMQGQLQLHQLRLVGGSGLAMSWCGACGMPQHGPRGAPWLAVQCLWIQPVTSAVPALMLTDTRNVPQQRSSSTLCATCSC